MDKHNKLNIVILLMLAFVLSSCASITKNDYYYDEITIRNNSYQNVRNVKIKVEKTGLVFVCSFIFIKKFGRIPFEKLFDNAIKIAQEGREWTFEDDYNFKKWQNILNRHPETKSVFTKSVKLR